MPALERIYRDLSRPVRDLGFTVHAPEAGMRLDALLRAHYPWRSRAHFQRMLAAGDVLLDGRPGKAAHRVKAGMHVLLRLPTDEAAPACESPDDLVVLYEDEYLVAIDKPTGMVVHPSGRVRHGTLINKLHARYRRADAGTDVVPRLSHRLDRDTSGVVLVVKNRKVDAQMTEAFTRRRVEKTYVALVRGVPQGDEGVIDAAMARDPEGGSHLHMRVEAGGRPARSRWWCMRRFGRHALLGLSPLTGRTHQLRVHLAWLGHPVLCDHLYGDLRPLMLSEARATSLPPEADRVLLGRLGLHARRLAFAHPVTGQQLVLESPVPADLEGAVAELARYLPPPPALLPGKRP